MSALEVRNRRPRRWMAIGTVALAALTACGAKKAVTPTSSSSSSPPESSVMSSPAGSPSPGTSFSAANVSGLGNVVVDGRGWTVYLLTSGDHKNVACDDASGCTKIWPDLPLPAGVAKATAGSGLKASLFGTMKLSDGETYPTYGGWLMYEYTGDTGPAQGGGEGIKSFGGTWYAISTSGTPVIPSSPSSSGGGGY